MALTATRALYIKLGEGNRWARFREDGGWPHLPDCCGARTSCRNEDAPQGRVTRMADRIESETLKSEIARLRGLGLPELRAVWEKYHGTTVPKTLRRNILIRSVAWHIQAEAAGGLEPSTRKYLSQVAEGARSGTVMRAFSAGRIKPGTKLIRVWQGVAKPRSAVYALKGDMDRAMENSDKRSGSAPNTLTPISLGATPTDREGMHAAATPRRCGARSRQSGC